MFFTSNHTTTNKNDLEMSFVLCQSEKKAKKKKIGNPSRVGGRGRNTAPDDRTDCVKTTKFKISSPLMSSLILMDYTQWEEQKSKKKV